MNLPASTLKATVIDIAQLRRDINHVHGLLHDGDQNVDPRLFIRGLDDIAANAVTIANRVQEAEGLSGLYREIVPR